MSAFSQVTYLGFHRDYGVDEQLTGFDGLGAAPVQVLRVTRPPMYRPPQLVRGLFGRLPITLLNYRSAAMEAAVACMMDRSRFDFVQIESVHMASYLSLIRCHASSPRAVVCDWHNLESKLMTQYAERESSFPRRLYALQTAPKIRAVERRVLRQCDVHLAVSEQDRSALIALEPAAAIHVVGNGVDTGYYSDCHAAPSAARFRVLFVGAMDYHANIDAVEIFSRESWPSLHAAAPDLVFTVLGRAPAEALRKRLVEIPGVEVTGTVPDVRQYYREAVALVVPLRIGGGTRLKILESMAAGVPVVSTAVGAEGLLAQPGVDFLAAEAPAEFCDCVLKVRNDPSFARRICDSAGEVIRRHYDWGVIGGALQKVYASLR